MGNLIRRLRYWLRQRELDAALAEELEFHRALKQQELEAAGLSNPDAQFAARRELGNITRAREEARAVWIWPWLESVLQDVRYAVRGLLASPAFTLPALAVLVVTMGLATGVSAVVDAILFRQWAVPDAERVVIVTAKRTTPRGDTLYSTSYAVYSFLRDHTRSIALAGIVQDRRRLAGAPASEASEVRFVTGSYFDVLKIPMAAGRPLYPSDDVRGAASAVVVSHGIAERHFGGTAQAIGAVLQVDDAPFTVVGVAAPGARANPRTPAPDAWIPISAGWTLGPSRALVELSAQRFFEEPLACCVEIVGRLAPGVDSRAAESEAAQLAERFAAAHGVPAADITLRSTAFVDDPFASEAITISALLSSAIAFILLLGCANVGNLMLARAASRRMDVNVRMALGATRGRLVRQLLSESLTLSVVAAMLSIALAQAVLPVVLQQLIPPFTWMAVPIDSRTMLFVFAVALVVSMLCGTLPALKATRLGAGGRAVGTAPARLRAALLGAQVAICLVLLIGAGLLARGLHHATGAGLGFSAEGVSAVRINAPFRRYSAQDFERISGAIHDESRASGLPAVAGTAFAPFTAFRATRDIRVPPANTTPQADFVVRHEVTPEYFEVLRIPLRAGQVFGPSSPADDVVVNEALARHLWPGQQAVGRVFVDGEAETGRREKRVVGVVGDARSQQFHSSHPTYYERATSFSTLLVRGGPEHAERLRAIVLQFAPDASPSAINLTANLRGQLTPALIGATAAAAVALLAVLLAGVGTLGVFSYLVNERMSEIGVRKALGATGRDIVAFLLRGVSRPLVGGLAVGLFGAQALGGVLAANLYGLSPRDPLAYAIVLSVLVLAALAALIGPARRALRVDPASMLRAE